MDNNMLKIAQHHGFAIPAFNYSDIWEFLAITEAAEQMEAPVYLASTMSTINSLGIEYCSAIGKVAYKQQEGKVLNHLDHCPSVEVCKKAVEYGYHSVMLDASMQILEVNITQTKEVVKNAHAKGVLVEAELGQIRSTGFEAEDGESIGDDGDLSIEPPTIESCVRLVEETNLDSLAIGIGNKHGFYTRTPKLNIELLQEVHKLVSVPLVLHGSSGLSDEVIRQCIAAGVSKVNVGTEVHHAYKIALAKALSDKSITIMELGRASKEAMKVVINRWIRLCNADGKRKVV
jgi:ketose-bisphosphate aldolase